MGWTCRKRGILVEDLLENTNLQNQEEDESTATRGILEK